MNDKTEMALQKFASGYNCAQSVLLAYCDDLNIDNSTASKIGWGFGVGMGRKQEICGAVTGGIIIIGAKYGTLQNDKQAATEIIYSKTRELLNKFQLKHGTFICLELLNGCNLMTEKGQKYFEENRLRNKICSECVCSVAEILEEIL
jgi:C_GCAxxG_C_C family probable redox protein